MNYTDPSGHKYYMETNHGALRTCTDGKITNKYEKTKSKPYGDESHSSDTAAFDKLVASDEIPYIVVPLKKKGYKFFSE